MFKYVNSKYKTFFSLVTDLLKHCNEGTNKTLENITTNTFRATFYYWDQMGVLGARGSPWAGSLDPLIFIFFFTLNLNEEK